MPGPNARLKARRERVPLTQAELAEQVGVAEQTIRRWEAGLRPQPAHVRRLCAVLDASLAELGFGPENDAPEPVLEERPSIEDLQSVYRSGAYSPADPATQPQAGLSAVRESIHLTVEAEGPAGGPLVHEQLDGAVQYYALNYSRFPPAALFGEVQRCRALVAGMLREPQPLPPRRHLDRVAGWLSALLGNLAFHLADWRASQTHLGTAGRLGLHVGDHPLVAWSRGAQSMVSRYRGRYPQALELARDGLRHAKTPLSRAQLLAWGELPALAGLQQLSDVNRALAQAGSELESDAVGSAPGRFGFDLAELELHAADAYVVLGRAQEARSHAEASLDHCRLGTPGWAAATIVLAQAEALQARPDQALELSFAVLDEVPPNRLRETTRRRLAMLEASLRPTGHSEVQALHERLLALPPQALPRT